MMRNVHRNHKAYYGGGGGIEVGEEETISIYIYTHTHLSLNCHRQNDSCVKMGILESHVNVFINFEG